MNKLPIKHLVLLDKNNPNSNKGILVEELNQNEFKELIDEYGDDCKGIPKYWVRLDGGGFQVIPNPKDSDEYNKSKYSLAIIRETAQ